ncbi:splicing regulatory glutamine/lysine-rich protein 1-like [Frieseomelitta varia]|uniref:splicing regulatory glutamine/lysine-rich protein 1-like n=1 Tax=Frieseomelitta varia TaxID=561572 RepID=UPI001CB67DB0|nr:splicing regulatory glutamine/lysine-rich protein 1-like [Frieseomelitta varia]
MISKKPANPIVEPDDSPILRITKKKAVKLAPFKFPFSRTSKSRCNDEKDKDKELGSKMEKDKRREKEGVKEGDAEQQDGGKEKAREDEEDNAKGQSIQQPMSQLQLTTETESNLKSPIFDSNSPMVRNEQAIRSSPPPSYEHVIEQTRLEHAAEAQKYEGGKNTGNDASGEDNRTKAPKILHKSSKELYRAVAKQCGITCKMSDHCRCLDCQSCYFDCEYDKNENQKTDGGLGAGTPMFISEVMQGSACVLF